MVLTDPTNSPRNGSWEPTVGIARTLIRNTAVALVMLVVVGVAAATWSWHLSRDEALRDAASQGETLAVGIIRPLATPQLLAGDPRATADLDRVVNGQLAAGTVLLTKIWRRDGTVLYSDNKGIVGLKFPLAPDVLEVFRGPSTAEVSAMDKAENALDQKIGPQVEVYAPFTATSGERLLFEVYLPLNRLPRAQKEITGEVLPVTLTVLVCLQLLQLPLWVSLVRSVRGADAARRRMLERSATASEAERRRLARFLHDDVIQNLAGVALTLDAIPTLMPASTSGEVRNALQVSGDAVRDNLGSLRGLLADLYPARLDEVGLEAALDGLLRPLRAKGLTAVLDVQPELDPPAPLATVAYTVAREAVRNAERHADPSTIAIRLVAENGLLRLTVADDGRGFEVAQAAVPTDHQDGTGNGSVNGHGTANGNAKNRGHFGLKLLSDAVQDVGGRITITSSLGRGTTIQADIPQP
jgi:two-component system, NarL family, sensor kinase